MIPSHYDSTINTVLVIIVIFNIDHYYF